MEKINIKCRTWYKGVFPSPIKLEIPGWAGIENSHSSGDQPQPWHCPPFVDGSTYGLELLYPFETECWIKNVDGKIIFEGDFDKEIKECKDTDLPKTIKLPPFSCFAPGYFGMTSALDIKVPDGYILRTEPHPAFYTDSTGTFPCCLPGHIQTSWWPKFFFVVFKNPPVGGKVVFKKNRPYGQVLVLPRKVSYSIEKMDDQESNERNAMTFSIDHNSAKIEKKAWTDNKGNGFSDRYRQLSGYCSKYGCGEVKKMLLSLLPAPKITQVNKQEHPRTEHKKCPIFRIKKK